MSLKGWEGAIRVDTDNDLSDVSDEDEVQSIAPTHGASIEEVYEIGSREPQALKEGNIEIGLDITANYVAGSSWPTRAGVGSTGAHTEYYVGIYPEGYDTDNVEILLQGKFSDWSLDITQDGVLRETVSFVGIAITVGTV